MNTTFTNYAEKKAKQFLNLLQGYTKGIRFTAILIPLLMGVNNVWGNVVSSPRIYYDNTNTSYEKVAFMVGHNSYSRAYKLTKIENTNLWYRYLSGTGNDYWGDATQIAIFGVDWDTAENNNISHRANYTNNNYTTTRTLSNTSGSCNSLDYGNTYLVRSDGNKSTTYIEYLSSGYNALNSQQEIKTVVDGTVANSKATIDITSYEMTDNGKATKKTASVGTGASSSYISAARTATTTLTVGTVATGYQFDGWYTAATGGTQLSSSTTYTYYPTAATTVYARFSEKKYTVTVKNDGHGTTTPSGAQSNVGQVTGLSIKATPAANYEFVNWTITSGSGSFGSETSASTTFKPTSAATIQANFRSTATNFQNVEVGEGIASVTGSTDPVTLGKTYNITATPKTGYTFSTWTANPAENATFGSATTANTTVTVNNGSVTVTASATENMSTLTTSNQYNAGDPGYEVPEASVNSIGYETTATVTATAAGNGYTFTGWTLTNCTRTDGGAVDATSITVRSNGDGKAAEVVANYKEDLATTKWYISGNGNGSGNDLTPGSPFTGWATNGIQMFKKSGHATEEIYYCTITANTVASNDAHFPFKVYNATTEKYWGNSGYWVTKENNHPTLSSNSGDNMKFRPYLTGTYEFKLDATNASSPVLTVTWPVYNQLRISAANPADATNTGDFDMTGSGTYTVTRSLNANTTYTFKIVYDSEWYGASSGNLTRASSSKTLSTSSNDLTIQTDVAGDYTFTFNSSDKKLDITYPTAYKVTYTSTYTGGTVSADAESNTLHLPNTEITFTATPKTGYTFKRWQDGNGTQLSTDNPYTHKMTKDITINAVFEENTYNINIVANPVEAAETLTSSPQSVGVEKVNISTTAKFTYKFDNWSATDGITITDESNPSTSITATKAGTVTANFIQLQPTTVYLKPGDNWNQDNARFAIHYWHDGQPAGWVDMTDVGCNRDYFVGSVPAGYTQFKFVRMNPETNDNNWDNDWNETGTLNIPTDGKNLFTLPTSGDNKWNGATTNWSTYSTPSYEITLSPRIGGAITTDPVSPVEVNTEVTVTITPSTGYAFRSGSIKIGTNEATNITQTSSTHTICGPTEIKAEFVTSSEQVVYLKPTSQWKGDKPRFAVHVWNNGGDATAQDIPMTAIDCNGDYYTATIPAGFHSMVFYRKSTDGTDVWNKTADLDIPVNTTNNCYTISSTSTPSEGSWSTYTPPTYDITINAPESGTITVTIGGNTTTVTNEATTIEDVALNAQMTVAFTPATGYELGKAIIQIGNNEKASAAGTYTVCGPTEITAYFVTEEDQVVYLRPTDAWLANNARFAAYAFNRYAGTEAARWIELTTKDTDYTGVFSATIPAGFSHVQFVRMPSTGEFSFDVDLAQTINYSIPTDGTNNRFILGATVTTSGDDYGKYQGSWEASNTPIWSIPGDWTGDKQWTAENATPLYGPNGNATLALQASITTEFKLYQFPYGTQERQWYGNSETLVRGNSADKEFTTDTDNCKLTTDIAGDYVFSFNIRNKRLTVTYPELPVPNAITVASRRLYDNTELDWFEGNGTEANPYKLYNDETIRLTVSPLTEVAGLTAYYKMGDNEEQTSNVFDWEETMSEPTKTTIQAYYKNATGTSTETVSVETPYYIQISLPFYLMTEPSGEININRVAAGENILVQFRSDAAATVGLYVKIGNGEEQKLTDITSTISTDYTHDVDDNIDPCVLHYIARSTAPVHDRIFEATTDVAIYKNVIIKVNDPEGWVKNAYMWRDYSDAVLTQWPGDPVLQNFGTWRVFSVKYPYYDRFIVNDGKAEGATQTIDYVLPADDTCYELLEPAKNGSSDPADANKYGLQIADCPKNLIVEDIEDVTLMEGEQIVVMPKIYVGLGYQLSDVSITQLNALNPSSVRADISGTNIVILGYAEGESNVNVTYNLNGTEVQKTFKVTVEKNTNITIQVKVPDFGDGSEYQWTDGSKYGIRYWGAGIDGTDLIMDYAYTDGTYMYAQAQIPLGTDGTINFHFYYEKYGDDNAKWRQTTNISATNSGCYTLKQGNDYYRHSERTADYCFNDENYAQYQVKVFMPTLGKVYSSNIVTNTTDILSFFAPGENETGYRAGNVQLYKNKKMIASIPANNFPESNVYTATIAETGDGLDNVSTYSGNFYIRTWGTDGDINNMGWHSVKEWNDTQKKSRTFTEFVSREGEFYNHYWVQDMNTGGYEGKDVSACVANEYNDDLAGKLLQDKHTNEYGDIKVGTDKVINVRFGYDPRTNYFGRAILQGSEYDTYLNIHCDNAYYDKDCTKKFPYGTSNRDNKMYDISTWVYQRDFYVPITNTAPSATLYVEATSPSTERTVTDHLLGYVINEITGETTSTPIQKTVIGSGTTNGTYLIRVIYDFKTNRIITAWLPQGTVEVNSEKTLNADVLFVRKENEEVPQIQLSSTGKIKSLESMFFAMELQRGDADRNNRHQEQYWFTLPFDCVVGSISGVPGYMQIWGIQRYNGKKRAENGWFNPSTTFWEWLTPDDVMHAGEGYLLVFDKKNAPFEKIEVDKMDAEGNIIDGQKEIISMMRLYFPSTESGFDMQQQSEAQLKRTYENHTCTITASNRYLQDSNWKVIGTTSYNNAGITGYTKDDNPKYDELSEAPSFRYKYEYTMSNDNTSFWYRYTPENGQTATYQSFFGYMVQFAGTINWQPIMSETVPEQIAARRYVPANERTSYTTRLELANAAGEVQDLTFVALDEKATTGFDQNKDLNKVKNRGTNIYTFVEGLPFAGNTLPMEKATVPVGVRVDAAGEYTFRMPDGTDGIAVTLVDNVTGTHTNMLMNEYTVTLNAGTIENRFYLVVDPDRTATSVENVGSGANGDEAKGVEKFLIDGKLFIRTTDGIFDAKGQRL